MLELVNENIIKLPHFLSKSLFLKRPLKYHLLTTTLGSNYNAIGANMLILKDASKFGEKNTY
jgi:hypothetical protein